MSDERDETRSFSAFDDATWAEDAGPGRRRPADDSTRYQAPAGNDDDRTQVAPSASDDDRTRVGPSAADDDRTRVAPSASDDDRTRVQPGAATDPTVVKPGARPPDATSVMPPVEGGPAWSGRAEVRAPQPGPAKYQQVTDWPAAPVPQRNDRWWMPILVGIIVLVLLAALGWGIYLIVQNAGKNDSPAPAATTSAPPAPTTTAAATETTEPTTQPTTTEPTTAATTTDPTASAVAIPALKGLSVADAKAALKGVGINSTHVIYRPSDAEPDTVFDSDPEEGQEVPPDTRVTLLVSAPGTGTATDTAGGN
jgi:PASTA domain-containing protein